MVKEKFRRGYNQRTANKYLYSTTNITRGTIVMAMGNQNVAHLIKNRSAYGDFIVVGRWYHENATKNFLKHFVFDRTIFEKGPHFPKIMFIYEVKGNTNILNQDVQKKAYIYLIFFLNN